MCGIVGQVWQRPTGDAVQEMLHVLAHRGPDDEGHIVHGPAHLGFRRLAIVDLSPAGHQPMSNEDGSVWIVFNGEIYNYHALVSELRGYGHEFRSRTDTETIIHAYEQWGVECLERFNGMFAFALWDSKRELLFCARDRFGVKPFYYFQEAESHCFVFASEIKALLQHPLAPRKAHRQMLLDFIAMGVLDHTADTCFEGIMQLPAAHFLLVADGGLAIRRYWDIPDIEANSREASRSQKRRWATEFYDLLEDSVHLRLQADVPVGTCLSGGLDSSTLVCLVNQQLFLDTSDLSWHGRGERQKTFTACYDDARHDEREYVQYVLAQTGAESHFTFPGEYGSLHELIPSVIWHQDEPFASTSILAQWHVMREAHRSGITVLLDGQGADELLGGYLHYFGAALADDVLGAHAQQLTRDVQFYLRHHKHGIGALGLALINGLLQPDASWLRSLRNHYRAGQFSIRIMADEALRDYIPTDTWTRRKSGRLKTLLYNQMTSTSLPALLHYEDRNSMAFSIEARTPFLDYRLAEFLAHLPPTAFIEHGLTKVILRDAMRGVLPEPVRTRLDKKGFSTPEDTWFRTSLRVWALEIIKSKSLADRGLVDSKRLMTVFEKHMSGEVNASGLLWRAINVELWARMFLDQAVPPKGILTDLG